jgi:hypothetical protein
MTLKERILSFKMEVQKKDGSAIETQVFKAIDRNKQGQGYLHVSRRRQRNCTKAYCTTVPLPTERFDESAIGQVLCTRGTRRGQKLVWKVKGKRVVSEDDLEIERIAAMHVDMKIMDTNQPQATVEGDPPRLMQDKIDDKKISTMNETTNKHRRIDTGGNNKEGPPSKLALDGEDTLEGSSVSSIPSRTRRTTESKLSQLTVQMNDMQAAHQASLQSMKEMMHTLMAYQMKQQNKDHNPSGGQASEIVEHQSPSCPFAGTKNASKMSVTPAGYRTDTGNENG